MPRRTYKGINNLNDKGVSASLSLEPFLVACDLMSQTAELFGLQAMQELVPSMETQAKATTSYNNVTGATREGTIAYVQTADEYDEIRDQARATAEDLNPGYTTDEPPPMPDQGSVEAVLWIPTDYSLYLIERRGNEGDFVTETIHDHFIAFGIVVDEQMAAMMERVQAILGGV